MSDILKPKRPYKKRETKEQTIKENKGGYIDEPTYDPVGVDELVEKEEKKQFPKTDEELIKPDKRKRGAFCNIMVKATLIKRR